MFRSNLCKSFVGVLALWVFLPLAVHAYEWQSSPPVFDKVVVFGDSLSDPGNVFALTGQYSVRPFAPIPSAPYAIGAFHFTNGETWVERVSRGLRSASGTGSAVRASQLFTNYAFGGARARSGGPSASPDLSAQIAMYFANQGSAASADSLHVIWFGANDVRDALEALAVDPTGATTGAILQAAITALGNNMVTLWSAGARTFMVPNVPNLALTPAVATQPAQVRALAAQLSGAYNAALAQLLGRLESQLPATRFVRVDVYALLNSVVANPGLYGIANTAEPCLRFGVVTGAICAEPWCYMFWDAIHPTAAVHRILAEQALSAVAQ